MTGVQRAKDQQEDQPNDGQTVKIWWPDVSKYGIQEKKEWHWVTL